MADTEVKKLLTKISLDTTDFQANVKRLKSVLDDLYQQEKKKAVEQKRALDEHAAAVKKHAEQMKVVSDQQLASSKKHLEKLQQTRQAYSDITQASVKLKAQTDLEALAAGTVLKKRQDIVAQCEIEMERLNKLRSPLQEESRILSQITSERQKQLALIEKQRIEQVRSVAGSVVGYGPSLQQLQQGRALQAQQQRELQRQAAQAARQVVPLYQQETARLQAQIATRELTKKKDVEAVEKRILAIIEAQTKAVMAKVNLDRDDVNELNRLAAAESRVRSLVAGGGPGGGGFEQGFFGKIQRRLAGTFGFSEVAGGVFAGILSAEVIMGTVKEITRSFTELITTIGPLQNLQATFARLGQVRGTDTVQFMERLRDATHGLVSDTQLLQFANAAWQSNMKVTNDQVVQLTHDVVALARAQGHAPEEAMQALQMAFIGRGRAVGAGAFSQLGRITGIQPAELMMQQYGAVLPDVVKRQEALNKVLDVTHQKMLAIGDPALTITDRLQILSKEWERTREAFAISLVNTEGFRQFLVLLDGIAQKLRQGEEAGTAWGQKVGKAFGVIGPTIKVVWTDITQLADTFEALAKTVGVVAEFFSSLTSAMMGTNAQANQTREMFSSFGNVFISFIEGTTVVISGVTLLAQALELVVTELYHFWQLGTGQIHSWSAIKEWFTGMKDAVTEFHTQLKTGNEQLMDSVGAMEAARAALNAPPKVAPGIKSSVPGVAAPDPTDPAYEIKMAKLRLQLKDALDKEELENTKEKLQEEKDANEEAYTSLTKSFADYIAEKKRLRAEDLKASLTEAQQDYKAKIAELSLEERLAGIDFQKQQIGLTTPAKDETAEQTSARQQQLKLAQDDLKVTQSSFEIQKQIAAAKYKGTVARSTAQEQQAQQQLSDQLIKDAEAAARTAAQAGLKIKTEALSEEQQKLQDSFNDGLVSADEYLKKRKEQIEEERQFTLAALLDEYSHMADTLENEAKFRAAAQEANAKASKEQLKLALSDDDIRIKSAEQAYERVSKLLATQAQIAAQPSGQKLLGLTQADVIQKEIALNDRYIQQLAQMAIGLDHNSAAYEKILEEIAKAEDNQEKYNIELAKSRDLLTPVGNFLSKLAGVLGAYHGTGISEVAEGLKAGAESFQAMGEFQTGLGAQLGVGTNIFKAVHQTGKEAFDSLREQSDAASGSVHGFTGALQQAITVVGNFMRALSGEAPQPMPAVGTLPHYQHGTWSVPQTGPAFLHAGEAVLPTTVLSDLASVVKSLISTFQSLGSSVTAFGQKVTATAFGTPAGATAPSLQEDLLGTPIGSAGGASFLNPTGIEGPTPSAPKGSFLSGIQEFMNALSGHGSNQAVGAINKFVGTLTGAVGAVGGFLQSTIGAQSTTSGLVGGALSGASLGSAGGPIGMAVGAAVGGILGAFSGHKNEQIEKQIQALTREFNQVVQKLNDSVIGLNQAIQQAQAIAQKIQTQPTGKKGSGKQAKQQALQQAEQTLQQLQEKQHQVLIQMQQQLDNLRVPTGYQEWLGTIEQILTQYKQFAEAAQNTQELAQAQEYLTRALQQYATTEASQVQSAEISAIQNGLQLNNLYLQRQQLMEQFAQQEQSIMSGGVEVREASASATKAGQLRDLQTQFNQQMDQLNMQISVSQYQYETQQKIYGLATTRVGLETQLLTLQFSQIDQQNASNAALLNIVNVIRSTPASQLATTPQLMAALGLPYSGPSASQVGPQIGTLGTAGTPQQFGQTLMSMNKGQWAAQQAGVPVSALSNPTPAQEQQILDWIANYVQKNPNSPNLIKLYQQLQSVMTGAPAGQFSPLYPVPPLYPAAGTSTAVPWNYTGGMAPGVAGSTTTTNPITGAPASPSSPYAVPPAYPTPAVLQTPSTAGESSPIYYLQDPNNQNLVPVYNTPTSFGASTTFTVEGQGTAGYFTTPSFTSPINTVQATSTTTGLGSQSGATTTLPDLLQYPGLGEQASTLLPGAGPSSGPSGPVILTGSSNPYAYPSYASGTASVPKTGLALLHEGEAVIPAVGSSAANQATLALHAAKITSEQRVSSIAMSRIGMETKLLQMKKQQTDYEMQHLSALQAVMTAISSGNFSGIGKVVSTLSGSDGVRYGGASGPTAHIEDSLYSLYRERGRYGEGGVAGNYP